MSNRKTNRSDRTDKSGRGASGADGFRPSDRVKYLQKVTLREKNSIYERITMPTRIAMNGFIANKQKNPRLLVPIHEKHRVKITVTGNEGEEHYVPASYVICERDEYIVAQAPTKDNVQYFVKTVWQEGIKLIVCVCDSFSASDDSKCFPYFSTTVGETVSIQSDRFKVKTLSKSAGSKDVQGISVYELTIASTQESDINIIKQEASAEQKEEEDCDTKCRTVTLFHLENWENGEWHNLDTLAHFMKLVLQKENQIMKKSLDTYVPPVMIQGLDGIGRCGVIWVAAILQKDIEKKESFDVEDLIKKFSRFRPGSFARPVHFFQSFALAFRAAALGGWTALEDAKKNFMAIQRAYTSIQRADKNRQAKTLSVMSTVTAETPTKNSRSIETN